MGLFSLLQWNMSRGLKLVVCTGVEQSQWAAGVKAQLGWLLGDMGGRQKAPKDVRPWSSCFRRTWTELLTALGIAPPPVRSWRLRKGWCSLGGARPVVSNPAL